jgi:di/tricarboxylate transporter
VADGTILEHGHELVNKSIKDKILIFPHGKGSTGGSYVVYQLAKCKNGPKAMINLTTETIIAVGAILGMMLRPVPEAVVLLVAIAVSSIFFKNTTVVLSGFASPTTWLVFSAFMLGQAFIETELGKRIAFLLIGTIEESTI